MHSMTMDVKITGVSSKSVQLTETDDDFSNSWPSKMVIPTEVFRELIDGPVLGAKYTVTVECVKSLSGRR